MIDQPDVEDRETGRLRALRRTSLLDSAADAAFDRLTRLGAQMVGAPVSLVTLIDQHRQFFKSAYGLGEPYATQRETPLAYSFCHRIVVSARPLVVNDSRRDPSVSGIAEMGTPVRAYLGYPLRTQDGYVLGAFCVIDHRPRSWSPREVMLVDELSQLVMTEIGLRAEIRLRIEAERRLREHQDQLEDRVRERTERLAGEVAQRRAAEAEIAVKADLLFRSNQDLEQFAYLASHDLQEPLRMVSGFIGIVLRRHGDQLDEQVRGHLAIAADGAARMTRMIQDLLAYSRVDREGAAVDLIDAEPALDEALRNLQPLIAETRARITRAPLPPLRITHTHLVLLLQNLIGNALKFSGGRIPEVTITARSEGDQVRLGIADRGIGIPVEEQERIFGFFQRLTPSTAPGSGMGLAICKKIVERHGGSIRVVSRPDEGATFIVLLSGAPRPGDGVDADDRHQVARCERPRGP